MKIIMRFHFIIWYEKLIEDIDTNRDENTIVKLQS